MRKLTKIGLATMIAASGLVTGCDSGVKQVGDFTGDGIQDVIVKTLDRETLWIGQEDGSYKAERIYGHGAKWIDVEGTKMVYDGETFKPIYDSGF